METTKNDKLDVAVSFFENVTQKKPFQINLKTWLAGIEKFNPLIFQIRNEPDEQKRKAIKMKLPCITPSGIFKEQTDASIIKHSGLMAVDIDDVSDSAEQIKSQLSKLNFVAYAGLSASGNVWALIPVTSPEFHANHFEALKTELSDYGIKIDVSGKNIGRKRFYSYDEKPYFNYEAKQYGTINSTIFYNRYETQQKSRTDDIRKIKLLIKEIDQQAIDITGSYRNWLLIGFCMVSNFGEYGRYFFHEISKHHPNYSEAATDKQFNHCLRYLRGNSYSLGTVFNLAKEYSIILKK
jgi:hypothetical protein